MTPRKPWSLWQAIVVATSVVAVLFVAPVAFAALLVYLRHQPTPQVIEVVRYTTVPAPSLSAPPLSGAPVFPPKEAARSAPKLGPDGSETPTGPAVSAPNSAGSGSSQAPRRSIRQAR